MFRNGEHACASAQLVLAPAPRLRSWWVRILYDRHNVPRGHEVVRVREDGALEVGEEWLIDYGAGWSASLTSRAAYQSARRLNAESGR